MAVSNSVALDLSVSTNDHVPCLWFCSISHCPAEGCTGLSNMGSWHILNSHCQLPNILRYNTRLLGKVSKIYLPNKMTIVIEQPQQPLQAHMHYTVNVINSRLINTTSSAIADKPPDACVLSWAALWWMTVIYWPGFPTTYPSPISCPQWGGSPKAIGFIYGMEKLEWLGYNMVKVAWWSTHLGTIRQRDRHTDSHVAIANVTLNTASGSKNAKQWKWSITSLKHCSKHVAPNVARLRLIALTKCRHIYPAVSEETHLSHRRHSPDGIKDFIL